MRMAIMLQRGLLILATGAVLLAAGAAGASAPGDQVVGELGALRSTASASNGVVGGGQIGDPLPDRTVPSPSDVAIAVDDQGGTFLCSMAGPDCGNFLNLQLMMIEARVDPGSIVWSDERSATITGKGTVILVPDASPANATVLDGVDFIAQVTTGGPGEATLALTIPFFEPIIKSAFGTPYGATGGFMRLGHMLRARVRP